ncbi:MAG: type VI secretion system baseplate subunit TssK [Nitrospira sp. WS110]|nr:type VI secretion system baseplate subunit TssK [Nitrospira sp. WS110]
MSGPHKIIWHEGMFLTPHHFQQWDHYYEQILHERVRAVRPFGWGVIDVRLDQEDLANGVVRLVALDGVMPDGTLIRVSPSDHENGGFLLPRSIDRSFPPSLDHLDLLVGIPTERPGGPNWVLDEDAGTAPTRYIGMRASIADLNSGEKREILLARENARILFSGEDATGFITLKLAELERGLGGKVSVRESYMPPCLTISASPWLMRLVRGLLELLSAKRKALAAQQLAASPASLDQARCSRLHILNAHLPLLSHCSLVGQAHPESLYLMLARLNGELSTVYPTLDPMDVPKYDHFNLYGTFREMDLRIRQALKEEDIRVETIPLTLMSECIWQAAVSTDQLESGRLYLVAASGLTDEQIPRFVKQIRIAAPNEVESIVSGALAGLSFSHVANPPPTVPVKAGYKYFRLDNQGPPWPPICRARAIGVYVPPSVKDVKLELMWTK